MISKGFKAATAFAALLAITYFLNDFSLRAAELDKSCGDRREKLAENRIFLEIQQLRFLVSGYETENKESYSEYTANLEEFSKLKKANDLHCDKVDILNRDVSRLQIAANIFAAIFGLLAGVWLTDGTPNTSVLGTLNSKTGPKIRSRKNKDA